LIDLFEVFDVKKGDGWYLQPDAKKGVRSPLLVGKSGPLSLLGLVMVDLSLRAYLSPGSYLPAIDAVLPHPFQSALAAMTPCLHFGVFEAARVCGKPDHGHRDNGLGQFNVAGYFPIRFLYGIN
jgi:hypothetical protein